VRSSAPTSLAQLRLASSRFASLRLGDVLVAEAVQPYELQRVGAVRSVSRGLQVSGPACASTAMAVKATSVSEGAWCIADPTRGADLIPWCSKLRLLPASVRLKLQRLRIAQVSANLYF